MRKRLYTKQEFLYLHFINTFVKCIFWKIYTGTTTTFDLFFAASLIVNINYDKGKNKPVFVCLNSKGPLSISFAKMPRRLASVIEKEGEHDQINLFFFIFFFIYMLFQYYMHNC